MKYTSIINKFGTRTFCRQDVLLGVLKENPSFNENTLNKILTRLVEQQQIARVGEDLYIAVLQTNAKADYSYSGQSDVCIEVEDFIKTAFPLMDFLIWDTAQLNEFFNHQIAQNVIVIEVESMLIESVFEKLRGKYKSIMVEPKPQEFGRYGGNDTLIIERLSSRYPKNKKQPHGLSIEKLTADLFADKFIRAFVNENDYPSALETIFEKYCVNETKLFNYARMRRVDNEIRAMIKTKTTIKLYTDKGNK